MKDVLLNHNILLHPNTFDFPTSWIQPGVHSYDKWQMILNCFIQTSIFTGFVTRVMYHNSSRNNSEIMLPNWLDPTMKEKRKNFSFKMTNVQSVEEIQTLCWNKFSKILAWTNKSLSRKRKPAYSESAFTPSRTLRLSYRLKTFILLFINLFSYWPFHKVF